ncbi:MAG TPA: ABC transporter permease [Firmicutes bacterium]|nr:ABC transporter permease [Bacillota bacterium]
MNFFTALLAQMPDAVAKGLIWGLMALGVYITYKILDFPDLTVDGSLCTGGAVAAVIIVGGIPAPMALIGALIAGGLTGAVTGLLHTKMGIPGILAGILTQLALYSINLRIMGNRSNVSVSVDEFPLMASIRYPWQTCAIALVFCIGTIAVLCWFFGTELGSAVRATGSNPNMSRAQGINTDRTKMVALILSNALVGLSGGLFAQYQSAADVNMGRGAIVIGLAAVIIGQVLFSRVRAFGGKLTGVVVGSIIYYIVIALVIRLGLNTNDMKLISAAVVAVFLAIPYWKSNIAQKNHRRSLAAAAAGQSRRAENA